MPRYVVVESRSGKPYGDTARLGKEGAAVASATDAASLIDRSTGRFPRGFGFVRKGSTSASLDVYRIDEAAPAPPPKDDEAETLALVDRHGEFVTSLVTYNS